MTTVAPWLRLLVTIVPLMLHALPGMAEEQTGVLGSPGATRTIDGKQLPPPPPKFGGKIARNAAQSKPWWPPASRRPRARPTCS